MYITDASDAFCYSLRRERTPSSFSPPGEGGRAQCAAALTIPSRRPERPDDHAVQEIDRHHEKREENQQ